jgi:hypothetical protein
VTAALHASPRGLAAATAAAPWSPGPLGSRQGLSQQPALYCCSSNGSTQPACSFRQSPAHVGQLAAGIAQGQSVRVSTAGGAHGGAGAVGSVHMGSSSNPRRLRLPLTGGCIDVYPDAVEVHSQHGSPICIDVLPATTGAQA